MKKQINPTTKAHLIRGAFYLLLLIAVCVIPFALAERNAMKQSASKPGVPIMASQLPPLTSQAAGTQATHAPPMSRMLGPKDLLPVPPEPQSQPLTHSSGPAGVNGYTFTVMQDCSGFVAGTTDTGNHTDDGSTVITLPFNYTLYDQSYSMVAVGSNGHLTFGVVSNAFNPSCIPITGPTYAVGPYWTDQCTGPCFNVTCNGCGIFTSTSGSAPNRIFNIEYRTRYYNSGGDGVPLNYEVRLYEGQTYFDVIYETVNMFTPPSARNLSVGVQQDTSNFTLVGCDTGGGQNPPVAQCTTYRYTLGGGTPTPTPTCSGTPVWQSGPDQPPARYAFQAALGTDDMLYVAGGQTADSTPIVYEQVSRYDYTTNTWSNVAPLPVPLGQGTIGAWNGKIYVAGGFIGGTSVTNALRIYDIATNTWTSGANVPTQPGLEAAAGAVVNGKFYVMGGDDFNNGLNTTFIYDIATNTWTTGATLPDSRTNTYGTAYNGMIYVYGGVILPAFTTTDTLLRYDPVANSWTNLGSAGTGGRGNYGGVSPFGSGQLLITDGADSTGASTTATHIFSISGGTFSAGPAMIGNRAGHAQGTLPDGRVLVADGFNTANTTVSTVELLTTPCASPTPTATPTATATATPTPSQIVLTARTRLQGNCKLVQLTWTGVITHQVVVYRNAELFERGDGKGHSIGRKSQATFNQGGVAQAAPPLL
jgi:hypothetical protein